MTENDRRCRRLQGSPRSNEDGFATAEFAVAMPAIVLVLAVVLGGLQAMMVHHRALHSASVGARLAARGESHARIVAEVARSGSPSSGVGTSTSDGRVTVRVTPHVPAAVAWAVPDLSAEVTSLHEQDLAESPS